MRDSHLRFDTVLYLLIGIGAYWAWSTSITLTSAFWPGTVQAQLHFDFAANLFGHGAALAVLSLLTPKLAPFGERRLCTLAAPAVIAVCTVALLAGYSQPEGAPLTALASLASGAAMAVMLFLWAEALLALGKIDLQHMVLEGSVISGLIMTVVILCLPSLLGLALCVALPFAMTGCSIRALRSLRNEGDGPERAADANPRGTDSFLGESGTEARQWARLLLCCFVLALPAGMYQSGDAAVPSMHVVDAGRTLFACVSTFVALAVAIDHRLAGRSLSHLFSRLIVPLMAGGLLILSVVGSGLATWGAYIMQTGYQLFLIYIYTEFARVADRRSHFPVRVFGLGTLAIDLGLFAGFGLISYTSLVDASWAQGTMLAIVYLLLLVGILVFPSVIEHVGFKDPRKATLIMGNGGIAGEAAETGREDAVGAFALAFGLSAREQEILQHLLRGRTLPAIADKTCLSYNTVKTHVSHIYQKAGVHTRDELLEMLEQRR